MYEAIRLSSRLAQLNKSVSHTSPHLPIPRSSWLPGALIVNRQNLSCVNLHMTLQPAARLKIQHALYNLCITAHLFVHSKAHARWISPCIPCVGISPLIISFLCVQAVHIIDVTRFCRWQSVHAVTLISQVWASYILYIYIFVCACVIIYAPAPAHGGWFANIKVRP